MLLLAPSAGCIGLTVQLGHMMGLNFEPAAYTGLKGTRVAVVCVVPEAADGPETAGELLAANLESYLGKNVKKIAFVPRREVTNWMDVHAGDLIDYARMGKSLKADRVLLVELASFSYHEDATLYQGRAEFNVTVFDTATGERVYEDSDPDMLFPANNAYHLTDMSEDKFKRAFVQRLAENIGGRFHANPFPERFAKERPIE
jgi:hypothetical protein